MKICKKIKLSFFILSLLSTVSMAADLPPTSIRAQKVGLDRSATCWIASVFAQGVFTGKPNMKDDLEFAQNLTNIYNSYGVILAGQTEFNNLLKTKSPDWKAGTFDQHVAVWKNCAEIWKGQ